MSYLSERAEKVYGSDFLKKSEGVAGRLGIPHEWLLAAMGWETGYPPGFNSKGPPWPRNPKDNGFGLIGFTPPPGHRPEEMPQYYHDPMAQLDDVEAHYRSWMRTLRIDTFTSPEDLYLIARGPYAIGQPDSYNKGLGDGKNKGQVLVIYRAYLQAVGVPRFPAPVPPPETSNVRYG